MHLMPLDMVLAALLLVVLPARQIWRSLQTPDRPKPPRMTGYLWTSGMITALLALLAAAWVWAGRSLADLGLDIPVTTPGLIGLGVAIAALSSLFIATAVMPVKTDAPPPEVDFLPETPRETAFFLAVSVLIGCGWELLYRGFLLWALTPVTGQIIAILAAATAYGASHGYKSRGQFIGSIGMALAFTLGYALTGSLWWLMLIHTAVPVFMLYAQGRIRRATAPVTR